MILKSKSVIAHVLLEAIAESIDARRAAMLEMVYDLWMDGYNTAALKLGTLIQGLPFSFGIDCILINENQNAQEKLIMKRWLDIFENGFDKEDHLSEDTKTVAEAIRIDITTAPGYHAKITLAQDVKMGIFGTLLDSIREEAEKEVKLHQDSGTSFEKAMNYAAERVANFFQQRYGVTKMSCLRRLGTRLVRD